MAQQNRDYNAVVAESAAAIIDRVNDRAFRAGGGGCLAVQFGGVDGEVGDEHIKQLVDHVGVGFVDDGLFEDQLGVGQRQHLAEREQEVDLALLFWCWLGGGQQ